VALIDLDVRQICHDVLHAARVRRAAFGAGHRSILGACRSGLYWGKPVRRAASQRCHTRGNLIVYPRSLGDRHIAHEKNPRAPATSHVKTYGSVPG
jgi:hypothetical protein